MRVFVTGATGFIGAAIVTELLAAGHSVLGLTRSDSGARALRAAGAEPHPGRLEDPDSLRRGASAAEGVIHCGFDHDFANFAAKCDQDGRVIAALGAGLAGSDRPLVITSVIAMGSAAPGVPAVETVFDPHHPTPRKASEIAGAALSAAGINVAVARLPQVHDTEKQGLVTSLIDLARATGVSAYPGDGAHRWAAAHLRDVARLYRLALEKREAGVRYHAVDEEGIGLRDIAAAVGRRLGLPAVSLPDEAAPGHFGWLARFTGMSMIGASAQTRARLGWQPTGPGLLADLLAGPRD
jgi:nucleoside-diphosphate-sugar epimerase